MIAATWLERLELQHLRKVILVTINPLGLNPTPTVGLPHLAMQPGSICLATHAGAFVKDHKTGRLKPFWPWLATWPTVRRRFWPHERRVEIGSVTFEVLADAGLPEALRRFGGGQSATARIDLWMDGVSLRNVIPLLAGRVQGPPQSDRTGGGMTLTITDGLDHQRNFPPGPITRKDFPSAPDTVVDTVQRQTIIGPFPERVIAIQIDRERKRFYVCDPPCTVNPSRVQKGGVEMTSGFRLETAISPSKAPIAYTQIVFDQPVDEIAPGVSDEVSCSGGVGITENGAIPLLLDYVGMPVREGSRAVLNRLRSTFDLSVLMNRSADAVSIVRDQLTPQTPFAFGQRFGRAEFIELNGQTPQRRLGIGAGLLARLDGQQPDSDVDDVVNAVEVLCGRDHFGSTSSDVAPLWRVYRDADNGSPEIRAMCVRSQKRYGRRFLQYEAPDLPVEFSKDGNGQIAGCRAGEILADLLIRMHARVTQHHTYLTTWAAGMELDLNWRVLLTDEANGLKAEPCRVVEITHEATGPVVTFQTEFARYWSRLI